MSGFPRIFKNKPVFDASHYGLSTLSPPQPKAVKHAKILIDDAVEYDHEGNTELAVKITRLAIEQLREYEKSLSEKTYSSCEHVFTYRPSANCKMCELCGKIKPIPTPPPPPPPRYIKDPV